MIVDENNHPFHEFTPGEIEAQTRALESAYLSPDELRGRRAGERLGHGRNVLLVHAIEGVRTFPMLALSLHLGQLLHALCDNPEGRVRTSVGALTVMLNRTKSTIVRALHKLERRPDPHQILRLRQLAIFDPSSGAGENDHDHAFDGFDHNRWRGDGLSESIS
jgi:hypothetical protein